MLLLRGAHENNVLRKFEYSTVDGFFVYLLVHDVDLVNEGGAEGDIGGWGLLG